MMMSSKVLVATRCKYYRSKTSSNENDTNQPSASVPPPSKPSKIEKSTSNIVIHPPPKSVIQKPYFNPHARATENYNIIEDLHNLLQQC